MTSPTPESLRSEAREVLGLLVEQWDSVPSQVTDAVTQALLTVLGSGPSIAAFDALLSAQAANGLMYQNAVANQQKTNLLGMALTAKCVRYMLDPNASADVLREIAGDDV